LLQRRYFQIFKDYKREPRGEGNQFFRFFVVVVFEHIFKQLYYYFYRCCTAKQFIASSII
jgi:hypothetical protein